MTEIEQKVKAILSSFNSGEKYKAINEIDLLLNTNKQNKDLLLIKAKMLININQINDGINCLLKVLDIEPKNYLVLKLVYSNLLKINNHNFAEKYINKLLKIKNNDYELLRDKAFIEYLKKNYSLSENFIKKAIEINKKEVFGLNIYGLLKIEQNNVLGAIKFFEKAISINPNYADSYNNIGKCFIELEKLNKAYKFFKKAFRINPKSELPIINLSNILSLKDKNKLAIKFLEKAKKINPSNLIIDQNIAICKCRLKDYSWTKNYYELIKNSENQNYDFLLGYSYLLLSRYNFEKGFDLFDVRFKTKSFPIKNIHHKNIINIINKKKKLDKKNKILIVKEQGVGDEILFSSMYNDLITNYSNVKVECDRRLLRIFNRSFKKDIFFPYGHFSKTKDGTNHFDNVLYAGSLTKYFRKKESDFTTKPYLKSDDNIDSQITSTFNKFRETKKVGISWKSVINIYGKLKSLELKNFEKIFNKERTIINLQYGDVNDEINKFTKKGYEIFSFKDVDLFNDFDSLISILKNLDVFVTVSNSTAHFAGALGIPTILICPKKSSTYYYWDYDNEKTPWYNSVKIIKFDHSLYNTINLVNDFIDIIV